MSWEPMSEHSRLLTYTTSGVIRVCLFTNETTNTSKKNKGLITPAHRVSVAPECIQAFNELKLGKSTKWIIFKISDDWKEIVVEETSTDPDYSKFREKLLSAKSKNKRGEEGMGGRYAVFDVEYEAEGGEGKRSKITFIAWVPDDAPQYVGPPYIFRGH